MAATRKKKPTGPKKPRKVSRAELSRRARKGAETKRRKELSRRALKGAETKRRKAREAERLHQKRVLAGKKSYRTRLAKERSREALRELRRVTRIRLPEDASKAERRKHRRNEDRVRETWHREKRKLEESTDDYDRYLAILEELSDDEAPDWDIAYGSTESAA